MNEDTEDQSGLEESDIETPEQDPVTIAEVEESLEDDLTVFETARINQLEQFQKSPDWEGLPHDQKVVVTEYLKLLRQAQELLVKFFPQ